MLPPEHINEHMLRLQAKLLEYETDPSRLENLTPDDFHLIGAYVQIFNFIEFNCRRSVEIFALAGLLQGRPAAKPQRTHISDLIPTIKRVVGGMDQAIEDVADSLGKLDEIELRRGFRNLLAHWAARRIPGEDAIVLFSMDGFDGRQLFGTDKPLEDVAQHAILNLADVRGLIVHMATYEQWIATKVSEWHLRLLPQRSTTGVSPGGAAS